MSQWLDTLSGWLNAHPEWLALAIFLIACMECLAIVGIIVPGTLVLFAVAVVAGNGALPLGEVLLLGYLGGLLGDGISYALGRRFHQHIRRLPGLRSHPQWLGAAETYFNRYGIASLLVGRFIGPLRPMLPMVAGMLDMPLPRFIAVSLVAAAGWSVAYLLPGWATGAAFRLPLPEGFWGQTGVVAAVLAVLIGSSIHFSLRGERAASVGVSALGVATVAALFFLWPHLAQFDQGIMSLVQEHRSTVMDVVAVVLTQMGNFMAQLVIATALCLVLAFTRQWRHFCFATGTMLFTALGNGALKMLFSRARPEVLLDPLKSYSMPSGHSSAAFALFLTLGVLAGRGQPIRMRLTWLVLASLPALSIALSRIYLGAHWPTDVLAGSLLGAAVCACSLAIVQWNEPLPRMAPRVWWIIVLVLASLLLFFAVFDLSHEIERYRYQG